MLTGPIQHFQSAIFEAWQLKVSAQLAEREEFRGAQFLDVRGSVQLLVSSHLRERDNMLLRFFVEVSGMDFFWVGRKERKSSVVSVVGRTVMGICFGTVPFRIVHVRELPEFMPLMASLFALAWLAACSWCW